MNKRTVNIILVFLISGCLVTSLIAGEHSGQPKFKGVERVSAGDVERVNAGMDPDGETKDLLNTIPPSVRDRADHYSEGGHWLILWNFINAALIAWIFLTGGLSAALKKLADRTTNRNWNNLIYIALYFTLSFLLSLPLHIYQDFIREEQYGFTGHGFIQWFSKELVTVLVGIIIISPLFALAYARSTIALFLSFAILFIQRNYISLANLHFKYYLEFGLLFLLCFIFIKWILHKVPDITSLPLIVFLFTCFLFLVTPVSNTIKRTSKMESDLYGLEISRDPDAFASGLLMSSEEGKANPGHWEEILFFDHPGIKTRIHAAMKWKKENVVLIPVSGIALPDCSNLSQYFHPN
jgi:hypothetical protein